jgi:hypothetical protein
MKQNPRGPSYVDLDDEKDLILGTERARLSGAPWWPTCVAKATSEFAPSTLSRWTSGTVHKGFQHADGEIFACLSGDDLYLHVARETRSANTAR